MNAKTNVVALKPRSEAAPSLHRPRRKWDFRLNDETCDIELTVQDAVTGKVVATLEYTLTKSGNFDLNLLRRAWDRWRGSSPEIAS